VPFRKRKARKPSKIRGSITRGVGGPREKRNAKRSARKKRGGEVQKREGYEKRKTKIIAIRG